MIIPNDYKIILNKCFSKPPRDVPEIWNKITEDYSVNVEYVYKDSQIVGGCTVVKIHDGFYGISWIAVVSEYQKLGYGTELINNVIDKYKGVFITKTRNAQEFYRGLGWTEIGSYDNCSVFCFINDINKINF